MPQLCFRRHPLGDFDLQRSVGMPQIGGALLDGCLERALGAPALRTPGEAQQREGEEGDKGG